jgi:murein L,D-transpeptidase YafK
MDQKAPILIRVFKEESVLEVWKKQKASGRYTLLKEYEICKWSGVLGPKLKEGDRQAPEGFYTIRPAQMNPNSSYHLSFNIGFPNEYDRAHGRTGTHLMVHGACSSAGCYSMTDEQIQEIYTLGRLAFEGGQRDFQVQAFPFRMTPENMAKHRDNANMPFWRMLKEGYDHFDVTRQPPKVDVCDRRYVFNSVAADNTPLRASNACPQLFMPDEIRVALAEKDAKDDARMLKLAAKLDRKDGTAAASVLPRRSQRRPPSHSPRPMSAAGAPLSLEPATVGSIPAVAADAAVPPEKQPATPPAVATAAVTPAGAPAGGAVASGGAASMETATPAPATSPPAAANAPAASPAVAARTAAPEPAVKRPRLRPKPHLPSARLHRRA